MAERKGDTKDTLLNELESIKGLLQDEDDIPILSEVIESIEPLSDDSPRQPSLFQSSPSRSGEPKRRPASITRASGENPFLPEHIRARLHGNRPPPLVEDLLDSGTDASTTRAALIDEVIQASLPDIEARLRARLYALSDEQLQDLASAGHTDAKG